MLQSSSGHLLRLKYHGLHPSLLCGRWLVIPTPPWHFPERKIHPLSRGPADVSRPMLFWVLGALGSLSYTGRDTFPPSAPHCLLQFCLLSVVSGAGQLALKVNLGLNSGFSCLLVLGRHSGRQGVLQLRCILAPYVLHSQGCLHCLGGSLKPLLKNEKDFLTELPTGSKGVWWEK